VSRSGGRPPVSIGPLDSPEANAERIPCRQCRAAGRASALAVPLAAAIARTHLRDFRKSELQGAGDAEQVRGGGKFARTDVTEVPLPMPVAGVSPWVTHSTWFAVPDLLTADSPAPDVFDW
jgi:hypothetical protein